MFCGQNRIRLEVGSPFMMKADRLPIHFHGRKLEKIVLNANKYVKITGYQVTI